MRSACPCRSPVGRRRSPCSCGPRRWTGGVNVATRLVCTRALRFWRWCRRRNAGRRRRPVRGRPACAMHWCGLREGFGCGGRWCAERRQIPCRARSPGFLDCMSGPRTWKWTRSCNWEMATSRGLAGSACSWPGRMQGRRSPWMASPCGCRTGRLHRWRWWPMTATAFG